MEGDHASSREMRRKATKRMCADGWILASGGRTSDRGKKMSKGIGDDSSVRIRMRHVRDSSRAVLNLIQPIKIGT